MALILSAPVRIKMSAQTSRINKPESKEEIEFDNAARHLDSIISTVKVEIKIDSVHKSKDTLSK